MSGIKFGTKVVCGNGERSIINEIEAGTYVTTYNVADSLKTSVIVSEIVKEVESSVISITVNSGDILVCSENIEVYTVNSDWKLAKDLQVNDVVLNLELEERVIEDVEVLNESTEVCHLVLESADIKSYIVTNNGILIR